MHLVDVATSMQLKSTGQVAACVPFVYQKKQKMTLYKGDAALATRRAVASKLTPSLIAALQRPRRLDDKPDFAPMQQLHDAGIRRNPITGTAVFNPDNAKPSLLAAYWKADGSIADTINTKQMGQTDEALDELQMRLHEHAAQITEQKQRRQAGALAKRSRASSPAASSSDEGTDTGAPARRQRTIRPMSDDDASATSVLRFSGSDDTTDHQLDRTDFIGSCSQCGSPEGHCVACGTCFCGSCGPLVCKPCVSPAASPLLESTCKPDAPLPPPSPPPSPPAQSQQLATLRGRSTTSALDRFMEHVRVDATGKRGKRSGAASSSHAAKVAKRALLEEDEAGNAPDSPSAARHGIDGAVACRRLLHACKATKPWRPAARSDTDWAAEELEWAARGTRPMLRACDAADPPAAVLTFAGDVPPRRAVAPCCLQPNATPCCVSPLGARATCCGCTSDSHSESEDSLAESDDEERDDAASAAGFEAWQSEADARVLQLVIDGVERMQADASLDGPRRALGVLQHVAHGVPDVFGSTSAYECWRHLLYADGLDESSDSDGSESDDDSPLPPPRPPPVSQLPPAPLSVSEETCCQKHGCKGCTPSWPKAARRAVRPIRAGHEADKAVAVLQFAGDAPTETMSIDGDASRCSMATCSTPVQLACAAFASTASNYAVNILGQSPHDNKALTPVSIDVEVKAEATPIGGFPASPMSTDGDASTPVDGAAMDHALSAMCRDMTALANGKLCLAGSYALHRHLCEQGHFERAQWQPNDIDIFYCSSGSGLDGDELRSRLSVMARSCQLQMLGVAAGDADERESLYDAFSKRPYAPCLDDVDEACVAAFAREQLMSLCSLEPVRSRQCARSHCVRTRGHHWGRRTHPSFLRRLGRYRIRSSIKLIDPAARDRWPPVFNLVEVEPSTLAHGSIAKLLGRCTPAAFADFIIRNFDMAQLQVAYYYDGSRLLHIVSDATRDAIRDGELRLSGCAFQVDDVRGTISQLGRICKYVHRGFRLPSGPLAAAPRALLDEPSSTYLRVLVWRLLKSRLHWEPITPPRSATPARRPQFPLLLNFAMTDSGQWRVVPPRSSAAAPQLAASGKLRNHAEALAVWTFVKKMKAEVYRTKLDMRACVPQYNGWRVLGQLRRSGKGIDRFDLYILAPDVLPSLPLRSLRPTNRAVRSFRGLHALLMQRFATTASGGGGAMTAARTSRRCPACCTLPCCRRASAGGAHADASAAGAHASSSDCAAPPLPPKKRYRDHAAARRDGRRVHDMQAVVPDGTAAPQPAGGGPLELTGMWENVLRVNGVVRDDMETAMARQERLRQALHMAAPPLRVQSAGSAGTCRVMRKQEESDETPVLRMAGDGDAQL
jgi:hypothetical protein